MKRCRRAAHARCCIFACFTQSAIAQAPISFGLEYPETPVLVAALSGVTDGWAPKESHLCVDSLDERRANIAAEGADDGERVSWLVLPTGRCVCVWSASVYSGFAF